jgi:hypothetical protein
VAQGIGRHVRQEAHLPKSLRLTVSANMHAPLLSGLPAPILLEAKFNL